MQFVIPIYIVVDAPSQAHVNTMKASIENFVPTVKMYLPSLGIEPRSVTVGEPYAAQPVAPIIR